MKKVGLLAIATLLNGAEAPAADPNALLTADCDFLFVASTGESANPKGANSTRENKLEFRFNPSLGPDNFAVYFSADKETKAVIIDIKNPQTNRRYLVFNGTYHRGEKIAVGADHEGQGSVDVQCTITAD